MELRFLHTLNKPLKFLGILLMAVILFSCTKDDMGADYYYTFDSNGNASKIPADQYNDKVYVIFTSATIEQIKALISNTSLQPITSMTPVPWDDLEFNPDEVIIGPIHLSLETKNGKKIPSSTISAFKNIPEVVSVQYMLGKKTGNLQGLTNKFMVSLKNRASYPQLLELAEINSCTVEEIEFMENHFRIQVHKSSKLSTIQTCNAFYETGLFVYASPDWIYSIRNF